MDMDMRSYGDVTTVANSSGGGDCTCAEKPTQSCRPAAEQTTTLDSTINLSGRSQEDHTNTISRADECSYARPERPAA